MIHIKLIVLGLGGVGRALVTQLVALRRHHLDTYGLRFEFTAFADSSGGLLLPTGRGDELIQELIQHKEGGGRLSQRVEFSGLGLQAMIRSIPESDASVLVADCTAADTTHLLQLASRRGWGLALANKVPLTQTLAEFQSLAGNDPWGRRCGYESTVGAGLPVIAALRRLRAAGDSVRRVSGSVSSTLGFVMSGLAQGVPFSRRVKAAAREGYAEPDPREDLSGRDVARKALIIARTLAWPLELADITIEGLLPTELEALDQAEFWESLPRVDEKWADAVQSARDRGQHLGYGFELNPDGGRVGILEVDPGSPLAQLRGTNQLVQLESRLYQTNPLTVQGRGEGVQATASGVIADLVTMAQAGRRRS